jgi:hypothetical protein
MKSNRLSLLGLQGFASLGSAIVGIFFPFLFGEAFGLSFTQILLWGACFYLCFAIGSEPINAWTAGWITPKQKILLGVFLLACFYALLGFKFLSDFWFVFGSIIFVLHLIFYWPSFHAAIFWSTRSGGRGSFLGSIQGLLIGVNMIAPLISGWLLDQDLGHWISVVSVIFFALALFIGRKIELPTVKDAPAGLLYNPLPNKNIWLAFASDGIQPGVMWLVWPIFLRLMGLSFVQIGSIMAIAALVEIFTSKIFGRLSDKKGAQILLHRYGIWARLLDLASRSVLFWFTQPWMLAVVGIFSGLLGPIFQMPMYTRMHEHVEKILKPKKTRPLNQGTRSKFGEIELVGINDFLCITQFFSLRERIIGIAIFLILLSAACAYHLFGVAAFPIFFVIAGLSSLGFRRF